MPASQISPPPKKDGDTFDDWLFRFWTRVLSPTSGGSVTQQTNKSTGVTLNGVRGQITMNAAALNANTTVSFVLTNNAILAGDVVALNHISGGTPGSYTLNARVAAGSATIDVRNVTAGALSEAIVISFAVF